MSKQTCKNCIHFTACQSWMVGTSENTDASNCSNFETIKDSNAYFLGFRDGAKNSVRLPKKKEVEPFVTYEKEGYMDLTNTKQAFDIGWNACLDRIVKSGG